MQDVDPNDLVLTNAAGRTITTSAHTGRRNLTLWRNGVTIPYTVTCGGRAVTPDQVDWSEWESESPRASGKGTETRRASALIGVRVTPEEQAVIRGLQREGETAQDVLLRPIRERLRSGT